MRPVLNIVLALICGLGLTACDRHSTDPIEPPINTTFLQGHSWGSFPIGGSQRVQVDNWCYVLNDRTLITFDLSQPDSPQIIDKTAIDRFIYGLTADSTNVYMSSSDDLEVYAVSESGKLQFSGSCFIRPSEPFRMTTRGDKLFWINISAFGILDISNPAQVTQIGSINLGGGFLTDFVIVGEYVFLWSTCGQYIGPGGLHVVDISDLRNPTLVTSITSANCFHSASIQSLGEYLYVTRTNGTDIYNISAPTSPTLVSTLDQPASFNNTEIVSENYLFTTSKSTINVYDVTNPTAPVLKSETSLSLVPGGISIYNTRLVTSNYNKLAVFSLANPVAPTELSVFELRHAYNLCSGDSIGMLADGSLGLLLVTKSWVAQSHSPTRGTAKDVAIEGNEYLYVADGDSGLTIFQAGYISTQTGFLKLSGNCCVVAQAGGRCFVGTTDGMLYIVDVNNRTAPALLGSVNLSSPISDIAIIDSLAVVACGTGGLKIVNTADPPSPAVLHSLTGSAPISHTLATGTHAFYIEQDIGLYALDIADPAHPAEAQQIVHGNGLFTESDGDMELYGRYILAATGGFAYLIDSNNPLTGILSQSTGASYCRSLAVLSGLQSLAILDEDGVYHYTITPPAE